MEKRYELAKSKIDAAIDKLNAQGPIDDKMAEEYKHLFCALNDLTTATAMMEYVGTGESYGRYYNGNVSMDVMPRGMNSMTGMSMAGQHGMDGDGDGRYYESSNGVYKPMYRYSGHTGKEHMLTDLKMMVADASTPHERSVLKECINGLESY